MKHLIERLGHIENREERLEVAVVVLSAGYADLVSQAPTERQAAANLIADIDRIRDVALARNLRNLPAKGSEP